MCQTMNKLLQIIVKKEFQSFNVKIWCISFCVTSIEPLHARKKLEQQTLNHRWICWTRVAPRNSLEEHQHPLLPASFFQASFLNSQGLICNSPHCLPNNSYFVSLENLSLVYMILYRYSKERFCLCHSQWFKVWQFTSFHFYSWMKRVYCESKVSG